MYVPFPGLTLSWGLMTRQPLWVILCRLPQKGKRETEEIVAEMKEEGCIYIPVYNMKNPQKVTVTSTFIGLHQHGQQKLALTINICPL